MLKQTKESGEKFMKWDLGMYSLEIKRDTVERLFDAVRLYGFSAVQFDFLSVCSETMPDKIDRQMLSRIRTAAAERDISITAVNGTFNMIHRDPAVRREGIKRFEVIANACSELGSQIVTLCAGSRSTEHMWKWHDDNEKADAWEDLLDSMSKIIRIAEKQDIYLGLETESRVVVNTAKKSRLLLDTLKSDRLKIVFDPANLFFPGQAYTENAKCVLTSAFELLSSDVILVHGKDIHEGPDISTTSAGRGIVDFETLLSLLETTDYKGPIILHGMKEESEFSYSVRFMRHLLSM